MLHSVVWVLLLSLWVDISWTRINKEYLPPSAQNVSIKEESNYNIQRQREFKENNYASPKYEVFEVHDQYETGKNNQDSSVTQTDFVTNKYSALQKGNGKEANIEHKKTPLNSPLDDLDLDVSLLSFATSSDESNRQETQYALKNLEPLLPTTRHDFFQQFYLQNENQKTFSSPELQPEKYTSRGAQNSFPSKGYQTSKPSGFDFGRSDSLSSQKSSSFKSPDYIHTEHQASSLLEHNSGFKETDYYLPRQLGSDEANQNFIPFLTPENARHMTKGSHFQITDHHGSSLLNQDLNIKASFKDGEYLQPKTDLKISDQVKSEKQENIYFEPKEPLKGYEAINPNSALWASHYYELNNFFKNPAQDHDYMPPQEVNKRQRVQQYLRLPSGYDFQIPPNAEQAIEELHKLPEDLPKPPETSVSNNNSMSSYDLQKEEHTIKKFNKQVITTSIQSLRDSKYSLPIYHFEKIDNVVPHQENNHSETENMSNSAASNFQHYYGFLKPANPEQVANQLHGYQIVYNTTDHEEPSKAFDSHQLVTQSSWQPIRSTKYLPLTTTLQTYNGSKYLPPKSESQPIHGSNHLRLTSDSQQYNTPDYFLPSVSKERDISLSKEHSFTAFKSPEYFLPVNMESSGTTSAPPTNSQGLSSYIAYHLNNRYGKRMPFSEYGLQRLPPIKATVNSDLSPMYRELNSRPQYYAPSIPYKNEAFNSHIFAKFARNQHQNVTVANQQTDRALEEFEPEDAWGMSNAYISRGEKSSAASNTSQSAKTPETKIRTVQIFNPNTITTLKVLESLDQNGVKTIKILGPSNQQPMGNHRVVKVLNGNKEQSVQTLKIFNDQHDTTSNANHTKTLIPGYSYLSLRSKREPKSKPKGSTGFDI